MMNLLMIHLMVFLMMQISMSVVLNQKGQYEDLVISIDSQVTDFSFLSSLQSAMKTFSYTLLSKTEMRFTIKNVKVILPPSYTESAGKLPFLEPKPLDDNTLLDEVSILIGPTDDKSSTRKEPYTLHLGGCGKPGEYIYLPGNFFKIVNTIKGKEIAANILVHEWAHYRWGLFDEYGVDGESGNSMFYLTPNKTIRPIGCPDGLKGWMLTDDKIACQRNANLLPKPGCRFHLHLNTNASSSVSAMFAFGDTKSYEFCDSDGKKVKHNPYAPSIHNIKCGYKSSWEVMRSHQDFETKNIGHSNTLRINWYQRKYPADAPGILIINDEGSYKDKILENKIKGALHLLNESTVLSNITLTFISANPENLASKIKEKNTPPGGSVWIITSNPVHWNSATSNFTKVTYLFPSITTKSDGFELPTGVDHSLHTVIFPGGLTVMDIASKFAVNILQKILPKELLPEKIHLRRFSNGEEVTGSFILDSSCGEALFIASDENNDNGDLLTGSLTGPTGETCSSSNNDARNSSSCTVSQKELLSFKISEGEKTRGKWIYKFSVTKNYSISVVAICRLRKDTLQIIPRLFQNSQPLEKAYFDASLKNNFIILAASVMYKKQPVLNATVTAVINSESASTPHSIPVFDDGYGSDVTKNDGIYTGEFSNFTANEIYSFLFSVNVDNSSEMLIHHQNNNYDLQGGMSRGRRMAFPGKFIDTTTFEMLRNEFGEPQSEFHYEDLLDPSDLEKDNKINKESIKLEDQERTTESQNLIVTHYHKDSPDNRSPGQVFDLTVTDMSYQRPSVTLKWTSVGDDGTLGTAAKIEIKFTQDGDKFPLHFHDHGILVNDTLLLSDSSLQPLRAKTKHEIAVLIPKGDGLYPENVIYFFALVYIDEANNRGKVSNTAYAFFKPAKYSKELQEILRKQKSGGYVILIFIIFLVLLGTFICSVKMYHRRRRFTHVNVESNLQ